MNARPALWSVVGIVTFVVVWEAVVRIADVAPYILLAPSRIGRELIDHPGFWVEQTWITAWHTLVGLACALVAALVAGAVLAAWRPLEWAAQPVLVLVMVTPWVAYITSVVLWLGAGTPTIVFMVAFVTFPPLTFAAVLGLRSADPAARELFRSVDAHRGEVFWRLRMPSALPSLFTALRICTGLGLAAAYFAEGGSSSSDGGLGDVGKRTTLNATDGYDVLWASIVCAALLGVVLLVAVTTAERRVIRWHPSQRLTIG